MKNLIRLFPLLALTLVATACQRSVTTPTSLGSLGSSYEAMSKAVSEPGVSGPLAGMTSTELQFGIELPAGVVFTSASWSFGDGSGAVSSLGPITHVFDMPGTYQVQVTARDAESRIWNLNHQVGIVELMDGFECISEIAVSSSEEVVAGTRTSLALQVPSCIESVVRDVRWSFGDGSPQTTSRSVDHVYAQPGEYRVVTEIYTVFSPNEPWLTLVETIRVVQPAPAPAPTTEPSPAPNGGNGSSGNPDGSSPLPTPGTEEVPAPTPAPGPSATPAPAPTPAPTPHPLACSEQGQSRESYQTGSTESVACGVGGMKSVTYKTKITEQCKNFGETLAWTEVSRTQVVESEGACQSQSCRLSDGSLLADGASRVMYTTPAPNGACAEVAANRTCMNGALSGSSTHSSLTCANGCGDFGRHGTIKTDVITGEIRVPMTCTFGEEGYSSTHHQVSNQACQDGVIVTSSTRTGGIKTPGACPMYTWTPTDNYTQCAANCGGKQTRVYECRDDKNQVAPNERCVGTAPLEERLCDANPEAARRVESSTVEEEAGASQACPSNQIGVILKQREVVKTRTYACIDHRVQVEKEATEYGPWVQEKYCRDIVAYRCSHDSLTTTLAKGRYEWMMKCQSEVPAIKEFLANAKNAKSKSGGTLNPYAKRMLYPTFMYRSGEKEKLWKAPTRASESCEVPAGVYVAAVCTSSCATPDQEILAQARANMKAKYVPFVDALTENFKFVSTLASNSSMSSKRVKKTRVDQWVTELVDSEHDILLFTMRSGRQLKVTPNHPLVHQDGVMKEAEDFKAGESLVMVGGALDSIVSIDEIKYFGKVYNVFVQSAALHQNIVVTNGYLNGTAYYQNDGSKHLNRALFRDRLTKGAFKR